MAPRNRDAKLRRNAGQQVPKDRTKPKRFKGRDPASRAKLLPATERGASAFIERTVKSSPEAKASFDKLLTKLLPEGRRARFSVAPDNGVHIVGHDWEDVVCKLGAHPAKCKWPECECMPPELTEKQQRQAHKIAARVAKVAVATVAGKIDETFKPMGKSAIFGKIKLSAVKGEIAIEMGRCGDPAHRQVLYAQLCPDDGDWALVLRQDGTASIQLTSLPDGAVMVKVIRR